MKPSKIAVLMSALIMSTPGIALTSDTATGNHPAVDSGVSIIQSGAYDTLRQRWAGYYLGDPELPMGEGIQKSIIDVNREAAELLSTLQLSGKGLWSDLVLDKETTSGQQRLGRDLYTTYQRLFTLARAYRMSGGELESNPELLQTLVNSLTLLNQNYYHKGAAEWGNWWHWQVGIAKVTGNLMVVLYDALPKDLVQNYISASRYFVVRPTHFSEGAGAPYSSTPTLFKSTGGNRTDNAQVVLIRGILDQNPEEIADAVAALSPVLPFVDKGDGFYPDGSFIQHKDLPYSGTYGQVMVEGLGLLLGLVADSPWQATDPELQKIYPLLLNAFAPLMVNGQMMDMVNGRAISRLHGQNHKVGHAMLNSMLLYVEGAPEPYKAQLKSFIKGQIEQDNSGAFFNHPKFLSTHQLARTILNDSSIPALAPRTAHRQFADMDRVVHHRPDWSFGIAMHSDRVGNYECMNGENLKGWYTADGMTYLYNAQQEHYGNFWPVVDPYRLPGTTVLDEKRGLCSGQLSAQRSGRQNRMDWVGGSQLGSRGTAGMNFTNWNNQLQAKKSWFMLDDVVISLGAGIRNKSEVPALTTMENRREGDLVQVTVNGHVLASGGQFNGELQQLHINDVKSGTNLGYVMLTPVPAEVSRLCRKGDWSDVGVNRGPVEGCFTTAVLPHDSGTDYAFAMLPGADQQKLDSFVRESSVNVLANNDQVQAIEHPESGLLAANFWEEGRAGVVTAYDPMSIMVEPSEDLIHVAVSDPTRSWGRVSFAMDGNLQLIADPEQRISFNEKGEIKADLSGLRGSSYQFTLRKVEG
ncbi:polysaccharide lyase 8 family protein [Endozoicomonas elysicola]|uniref:Hyaluronate lyase n=1 Tax=Endozoicomonas elysicola TaxID=305900 RepID=A0A081KGR5_9GAMM|nr:polysaccharide lyase 8 family protein [Endozoicomonas elysicola]KEI73341.1 hypothetical protein GV64_23815 [Endozoicomonas elysicola]